MASMIYQLLLFNQSSSGVFLIFSNKNNSLNDSYSNMGHPRKRMYKIITKSNEFLLNTQVDPWLYQCYDRLQIFPNTNLFILVMSGILTIVKISNGHAWTNN
jgi:hypothetical protein